MRNPNFNGPSFPNMAQPGGAAGVPPDMMGNINEAFSRYGGKSQNELMNELAEAKDSGLIDTKQLSDIAAKLAPMLTAEQRERLSSVLQQLT